MYYIAAVSKSNSDKGVPLSSICFLFAIPKTHYENQHSECCRLHGMTGSEQALSEKISKYIPEMAVGCLMLLMVLSQFSYFWDRTVFGHDDLSQIESYYWNLESEGRWLIYLLFPVLRYCNTHVALVADIVFVCVFGYVCARRWLNSSQSILIAMLVTLAPSFVLFLDWPIIALPSIFLLAVAALVSNRIPLSRFFLVFGVLFNATYSNVYFLLPLLFLNEDSGTMLRVLFYWLIGYVVGFVVAELVTWAVCGHFVELAEWRKPHYIRSWADIEINILRALRSALSHVRYMGKECGLVIFLSIVCFAWLYRNSKMRGLVMVLVLALVSMSCYAQSVPVGVAVSMRTAHCLYFALLLFVAVSCRNCRYLMLFVVLIWGGRCLYMNAKNLEWQNAIRSEFYAGITHLNVAPVDVNGMVVLANDDDVTEALKIIERAAQVSSYNLKMNLDHWAAAPRYAGFKSLWYRECVHEKIEELGIKERDLSYTTRGLYSFALCKGYLFVRFNLP